MDRRMTLHSIISVAFLFENFSGFEKRVTDREKKERKGSERDYIL
jgi:hypothetical protein